MYIFPAIDLYEGRAVRLYKGDYSQMTVYNENPVEVALDFAASGAEFLHLVDLEGAKLGTTPNLGTIRKILDETGMFTEVGGGIRDMQTIEKYLNAGVSRVILGTAAVTNKELLERAGALYGDKIAVGADIKDGKIAIKGWTQTVPESVYEFFERMQMLGISTVICTDISKDGAMLGTNRELYRELSEKFSLNIIASGGVSTVDDVRALAEMKLYGAIIGRAYYTGAIDIREAIEVAK